MEHGDHVRGEKRRRQNRGRVEKIYYSSINTIKNKSLTNSEEKRINNGPEAEDVAQLVEQSQSWISAHLKSQHLECGVRRIRDSKSSLAI